MPDMSGYEVGPETCPDTRWELKDVPGMEALLC
jgi:hypothetical protein